MKHLKFLTAAFALGVPGVALAATDGTLGATSTGSINVGATVSNVGRNVQVRNLDDVDFGNISLLQVGSTQTHDENFCVTSSDYATNPNAQIRLTVTQDGAAGFALASGANTIPFTLSLIASNGGFGGMTDGLQMQNIPASTATCSAASVGAASITDATDRNLRLRASMTVPTNPVAGIYTGTLTLLAAPQ